MKHLANRNFRADGESYQYGKEYDFGEKAEEYLANRWICEPVKVKLSKDLKIEGKKYKKDSTVTVTPDQAEGIVSAKGGVAEKIVKK